MGNSCRYLVQVDSFVHDELGKNEKKEFEEHAASCSKCRSEMESVRRMKGLLDAAYEVKLDETFAYGVINALRKGKYVEERKGIRLAIEDIAISFATLLVIVLLGIQMFSKPALSSVEMAGTLTTIERSSLEQTTLSNDQVLELVLRSK